MNCKSFEQGPIRPPSEAKSLLVRVTRSCPWNRCAFCAVYKGQSFSARPTSEILADLDAMQAAAATVRDLSQQLGHGGEVTRPVLQAAAEKRGMATLAWWLYHGGRSVFLQDANALASPAEKITAVLTGLRERFGPLARITSYSQTRTLRRLPVARLETWRRAGLSRVHVGLESGADRVLELMSKGVTAAKHLEAGRNVLAAGLHLCCYVMPGLGGAELTAEHAEETARLLTAIQPSAVRLRSLVVPPMAPLARLVADGRFEPLADVAMVAEIRTMLAGMTEVKTKLVSDHDLNLLGELTGELPRDLERLLAVCDRFLAWPARDQHRFILARRARLLGRVADLEEPGARDAVDRLASRFGVDLDEPIAAVIERMRRTMV